MARMRMKPVILRMIAASAMLAGFAAQEAPPTPSAPPATNPEAPAAKPSDTQPAGAVTGKPQRIFLRVNRNTEVKGFLELEDDNVIVVRDLHGERHSFAKPRVGQIVRLTEPEQGQTGMVRMIDGQVRQGVIIEDDFDHVIVEIEGIRANLKRSIVDYVVLSPTTDELYAEYKRTLDPLNYDAHLTLCRWLYEKRRYQQSKEETLLLLEKVEMPEARQLLNVVEAQLALLAEPKDNGNPRPENAPNPNAERPENVQPENDPDVGPVHPADILPDQFLTEADVNIVRVYEIDFENPPRLTIKPETIRELIEKYGTNPLIPANQTGRNSLFRAAADSPLQIVRLMFEMRTRDMYSQIQVDSEPHSLNLFRRRVHDTWLINNCATNACHGGMQAGRFFLHRRDYKDEKVRTTNLLILERLKLDLEWPLINYDKPEDSLIIQYGLPRNFARKPHPIVNGWKSAFSPTNPKLMEESLEWIRSMMQPRPQYPVDFDPPTVGPEPGGIQPAKAMPDNRVPR